MGQIVVIANPLAGQEKGEEKAFELIDLLESKGHQVTLRLTLEEEDAKAFAQEACQDMVDQVYLLGGDGTLSSAINGIAASDYRPQVAFVPVGTINNLARMLGLALDDKNNIQQFQETTSFAMDIGQVGDHYFISTVTAGSLPNAFEEAESQQNELGMFALVMGGLKAINQEESSEFRFVLDGQAYQDQYDIMVVGLGNSVAGVPTFFPDTTLNDGYLNMFALKQGGAFQKLGAILEILKKDKSDSHQSVDYFRFKEGKFELLLAGQQKATVDGEVGPSFPLDIQILAKHIQVIIPKGTRYDLN